MKENIYLIKNIRRKKGLTLAELSKKTGYDVPHLSRLERGAGMKVETLRVIARGLGVETGELLKKERK